MNQIVVLILNGCNSFTHNNVLKFYPASEVFAMQWLIIHKLRFNSIHDRNTLR